MFEQKKKVVADFGEIKEIWQQLENGLAFKMDWFNNDDDAYLEELLSHLLTKKQQLSKDDVEVFLVVHRWY